MNSEQESTQEETMLKRCNDAFNSRMEDIRILTELEQLENDGNYPNIVEKLKYDYGDGCDYGLSLDYVEEGTFNDQREPYIRFQLSWGGPSEEFRIYANNTAEFWFLDWFKGEHKNLSDSELNDLMSFLCASDYNELKERVKPQ